MPAVTATVNVYMVPPVFPRNSKISDENPYVERSRKMLYEKASRKQKPSNTSGTSQNFSEVLIIDKFAKRAMTKNPKVSLAKCTSIIQIESRTIQQRRKNFQR